MNKKVALIIVGIIVAVFGFLYLTRPAEESNASPSNHILSEGSTGVVLIEYGDFQCPACGAYHPILKEVKAKYEGQITFQFRHFPLESLHKNARAASRAAEAAHNQGKFWEMHDMLFENQSAWANTSDPLSVFESYANAIGIADPAKFATDYRSSSVNDIINADLGEGRKLGASSTPTFILDGVMLEENPSATLEAFSALIDEAISKKTGQSPAASDQTSEQSTTPDETTPEQPAQ